MSANTSPGTPKNQAKVHRSTNPIMDSIVILSSERYVGIIPT